MVMGKKRLGVGCQGPESAAEIALEIAAMASGPRKPRKTHPNPCNTSHLTFLPGKS